MRVNLICRNSIIRLAALALLAISIVQPQVRAQEEVSFVVAYRRVFRGYAGANASVTYLTPRR